MKTRYVAFVVLSLGLGAIPVPALAQQSSWLPPDSGPPQKTPPQAAPGKEARIQNATPYHEIPDPLFGVGLAGSIGLASIERGPWNEALARAGRLPIENPSMDVGGRLSIFYDGWEFSVVGDAFLPRAQGADPATTFRASLLMSEISYDFFKQQLLTLGPMLGAGWMHSRMCLPSDATDHGLGPGPLFHQILLSPGRESCLSTDALLVRTGLVMGLTIPTPMQPPGGTVYVNLRPTYSFAVGGRRYGLQNRDIPSFDGPSTPHPSFGFTMDVGILIGTGARKNGP